MDAALELVQTLSETLDPNRSARWQVDRPRSRTLWGLRQPNIQERDKPTTELFDFRKGMISAALVRHTNSFAGPYGQMGRFVSPRRMTNQIRVWRNCKRRYQQSEKLSRRDITLPRSECAAAGGIPARIPGQAIVHNRDIGIIAIHLRGGIEISIAQEANQ
jgi:hypothetical protein